MTTIDKKGAFHDSAGRYADKPGSGVGGFQLEPNQVEKVDYRNLDWAGDDSAGGFAKLPDGRYVTYQRDPSASFDDYFDDDGNPPTLIRSGFTRQDKYRGLNGKVEPECEFDEPFDMGGDYGEWAVEVKDDGATMQEVFVALENHGVEDAVIDDIIENHFNATVRRIRSSIDQSTNAVVFDSDEWRESVGLPLRHEGTYEDNEVSLAESVKNYLDGNVWQVGCGESILKEGREPRSINDIDFTDLSGGYVGDEDYAKAEAVELAGV